MNSDRPARALVLDRSFFFEAAVLTLLCLIPVLLYLPFLGTPFERDEGVYATIAKGLLHGQVPYRDLFDNKPPLVYLWYAAGFQIFGENVAAPRLLAAVFLSLTTLALYSQARMVLPRRAAYLAGGLFALSTGLPWVALHANTEAYMLLPMVTSFLFFTIAMRSGNKWWFLYAGLMGGFAIMTKQVAVWNLIALLGVALVWKRPETEQPWRRWTPSALLLLGALAGVVIVAVPFALSHSLGDLVYANFTYNWSYFGVLSYADRLGNLSEGLLFFFGVAAPFLLGALAGLYVLIKKRSSAMDYLLILWALASVIGVASGGRFFPHYFLQLMPAFAVLTAILLYERLAQGDRVLSRPAVVLALFVIIVSVGTNTVLYLYPRQAQEQVTPDTIYIQKSWEEQSEELGLYIKERTAPDETIFNYGRESQIYFYADRQPPIPYFYDWVLRYEDDALPQIIEGLRRTMPVYIIDSAQEPLDDFQEMHPPEFRRLLHENYEYAGRIYFADVYRLRESARPVAPAALKFDAFMP